MKDLQSIWGNFLPSDEDACLATAEDSTQEPVLSPVGANIWGNFLPSDEDACLATASDE